MYLLSFEKFAGNDKIFVFNQSIYQKTEIETGDLIKISGDVFLCMGDEIAFNEQYNIPYRSGSNIEILYKKLLQIETINIIHRIVYTYYSTYKILLKLFLPEITNIDKIIISANKTKKNIQKVYLYPDLWTLYNSINIDEIDETTQIILYSQMTKKQKDKARRQIKQGLIQDVFCTHGELFQDRNNLKEISIKDEHKRYYKNSQDPRYKTTELIKKISKTYNAQLFFI